MSNRFTILKFSIYALCSVFILNSCASDARAAMLKSYTVEIKGMKFQPAELIVHKGDTVVWVNRDIVAHDVTEESNKTWTSSAMPVGKSWSLVVTQNANYYCSIHIVMKGKLVVQ